MRGEDVLGDWGTCKIRGQPPARRKSQVKASIPSELKCLLKAGGRGQVAVLYIVGQSRDYWTTATSQTYVVLVCKFTDAVKKLLLAI